MNKYNPLVSIIIPVYNGGDYMREAIDSAISQTYDNIEIIVVNDGSTDNGETEKIALSYGDKIKYYLKDNGGCASALNYGISKMQGEWFSWLSHDDVYEPDKVKKSIEKVAQNKLENTIVMCSGSVIDSNSKTLYSIPRVKHDRIFTAEDMYKMFLSGKSLNGCALLIPKAALDLVGPFSIEYVYILDWVYWMELALKNYSYFVMPDVLVKNRKHGNQVSVRKHNLLEVETKKYILELINRQEGKRERLLNLWLYCYRIGFNEGALKVKERVKIPFNIKLVGICRKLRYIFKHLAKKTIGLLRKNKGV